MSHRTIIIFRSLIHLRWMVATHHQPHALIFPQGRFSLALTSAFSFVCQRPLPAQEELQTPI